MYADDKRMYADDKRLQQNESIQEKVRSGAGTVAQD